MHLFKHFFKLFSRNKLGFIIFGIITIIMAGMLIYSAEESNNSTSTTTSSNSYDISYVDNDNSTLSKGIIDYLSVNNTLSDYKGRDEIEISNMVFFGITHYHFTIPDGFSEAVASGELDQDTKITYATVTGSNGYVSYEIDSKINNYINTYTNYCAIGLSEKEAAQKATDTLVNEASVTIVDKEESGDEINAKELAIFNINQYFVYLIMGMLTLGIGHTILITNKKELTDRNEISPVPPYMTKLTNTLGLVVSGIVIWAVFMVFNFTYGADTDIVKDYGWVILINSFLCMLICCAITSIFTNYIKSSNTLSMVTNIFSLAMAFLCGVFVPMRFLSDKLLVFSKFLPFYWSVYANNMTSPVLSKYDYDLDKLLVCFAVELLFAIALTTVAVIGNSKRIIKA